MTCTRHGNNDAREDKYNIYIIYINNDAREDTPRRRDGHRHCYLIRIEHPNACDITVCPEVLQLIVVKPDTCACGTAPLQQRADGGVVKGKVVVEEAWRSSH